MTRKNQSGFLKKKWGRPIAALLVFAALVIVSGNAQSADVDRKVRNRVVPVYPELARKMKLVANVKVQVTVAPNGAVVQAKPIGGHPLLIAPSVDAAKMFRYEPANSTTTNTIEFHFGVSSE
jgi:outer membrane biosynthesis protein TonB